MKVLVACEYSGRVRDAFMKNLPLLQSTSILQKPESGRLNNQTPSGNNKLGPSPNRWKKRSLTYLGIAAAMADQWG